MVTNAGTGHYVPFWDYRAPVSVSSLWSLTLPLVILSLLKPLTLFGPFCTGFAPQPVVTFYAQSLCLNHLLCRVGVSLHPVVIRFAPSH